MSTDITEANNDVVEVVADRKRRLKWLNANEALGMDNNTYEIKGEGKDCSATVINEDGSEVIIIEHVSHMRCYKECVKHHKST